MTEYKDGIIIINKPKNLTSHDIVYKIKKITGKKVGHTGTLDPLATGVLPILIGKGTLCSKYLINHDKEYEVTLKLGETTNTLDQEGEITEKKEVKKEIYKENYIKNKLKEFIGIQEQIPPIYSAIKVKGKKLYEYARKGEKVEIKPRKINIYEINLIKINENENEIKFKVKCGKGTYIRSLCKDIAIKLDTVGYMKELKRTKVGIFDIKDSIKIDENENEEINEKIIPIEEIFKENEKIEIEEKRLKHFLNGVKITVKKPDGIYNIYYDKNFIGTGIIKENLLKRDIIIKNTPYN